MCSYSGTLPFNFVVQLRGIMGTVVLWILPYIPKLDHRVHWRPTHFTAEHRIRGHFIAPLHQLRPLRSSLSYRVFLYPLRNAHLD
ncbi:BQ5605_C026g10115 [Microbotryum silenes-dioicae]|uniref:BQ5605_C026g10115 protein n=1 Tax=Microbotryum silenes-dioicae TaxID=796604 RepID=A0A2X0MH83_9BASI|nr:BQ5605_C091g13052 [Microbotryum silenes-dioicae]SGZ27534.1 BQ5605_C026g10115 [Microbotryum silenes-dioicae]